MSFENPKHELRETKENPGTPALIVDFIRHGMPEYTEKEKMSGELEGKLTEKGKGQIRAAATELAGRIDKDTEIVVIWTSGKKRAKQSALIVGDIFREQGILLLSDPNKRPNAIKEIGFLRDIKTGVGEGADSDESSPFWDSIYFAREGGKKLRSGEEVDFDRWLEFWVEKDEEKTLPLHTETPEQVKKRSMTMLAHLIRVAKHVKPKENKRLRMVIVGHEEGVRDLLEESLHMGTQKGNGPAYGEMIEVGISPQGDDAFLDVSFRGKKGKLVFDREKREIKRTK